VWHIPVIFAALFENVFYLMKKLIFFFCVLLATSHQLSAQDTLPKVSVKNLSGRIVISWRNSYGANIANINIQRSYDSIRNFTTIGSVLEPNNRENGYVDTKAPKGRIFYRVFVAFEGGSYIFSKSYRPVFDTTRVLAVDSMVNSQLVKDSLKNVPPPPPPPKGYVPSKLIFVGKENNVIVQLQQAASIEYSVQFFNENHQQLFEIKKIPDTYLVIEKVNFQRAGWFYFKLFEKGKLLEKNQFYIPREGKHGIPPGEQHRKIYEPN
jgi:hypothetical protein